MMAGVAELVFALTHHGVPGDFNERHPGLRFTGQPFISAPAIRPMAAIYKNSEGRATFAFGAVGTKKLSKRLSLFAEGGLATGYSAAPLVPMVRGGFEMTGSQKKQGARLFGFPAVNKRGQANVGIGLEFFKRF